jgi:hypothetical protein
LINRVYFLYLDFGFGVLFFRQQRGSKQSAGDPGEYSKSIWMSLKWSIRSFGFPGRGGVGWIIGGFGTFGSVIFQFNNGFSLVPQFNAISQ